MQTSIQARAVSKAFGAVRALQDVDLDVAPGSIHAIVGENGAGKSTLGKVLCGVIRPDEGMLRVDGREVRYGSPADALADGITNISQEIALLTKQTVAENVFLGIEPTRRGVLDRAAMRRAYDAIEDRTGFEIDPDARVASLRLADQKLVEVMQAVARDARAIVMDEPTAMLADDEAEAFRDVVRDLRSDGRTIIYVSHFLDEVLELADRVTVMRNGEVVDTLATEDTDASQLIELMLGRSMNTWFPTLPDPPDDAEVALEVEGLASDVFDSVSFEARRGEIVGFAGLVGSGRSRLARTIFAAEPRTGGRMRVKGRPYRPGHPSDAIALGVHYLPESRKEQGLLLDQTVANNMVAPHLKAYASFGGTLRLGAILERVRSLMDDLDLRPRDPRIRASNLSGGNQQKLLFGMWLFRRPDVLIIDEPTRGVDVGAKQAIYHLITELAKDGMCILLISSEIEEILGLAHRVLVMREGAIVASVERGDDGLDQGEIMRAAFGGGHAPAPVAAKGIGR